MFYTTIHTHDNLYIMYEIAEISAPRCIDDILKYLMDFDKSHCIVELFDKWCRNRFFTWLGISFSTGLSPTRAQIGAFVSYKSM